MGGVIMDVERASSSNTCKDGPLGSMGPLIAPHFLG